jgi:dehydrogenase/reductase SDR family protein 7B
MNFKNKNVWITGASSGIGKALALEFNRLGANVILSARNIDKLNLVKSKLTYPDKAHILPLDLMDYQNLKEKVVIAESLSGGVDILINNGGISQRSLSVETIIDVDKKLMEVNYLGTVSLTKAILPFMIKKKSGQIVTISSVVGLYGVPGRASYAASKHALHGFFDSLRAEVYEYNIHIALCCPGFIQTDVSINALTGDGSKQGSMDNATAHGISTEVFSRKFVRHVLRKKDLFYIAGFKERLGIWASKYWPSLFKILVRKLKTT